MELLIFLDSLGEKWEDYALFLGFTNDEIYGLKRRSFGKTQQEIKNFSKVWRIPDMERANDDILHCVLEEANIDLGKQNILTAVATKKTFSLSFRL